ncbi:cyclic peptide export ABC transporter [Stappia sp. F7233]|uniref:Cyclic peptide export ABC transporter n=1 Tax=Stappia albiluteola TaxID=2758565 RepID=A0A839AI79_9HYPH|nr:cyclic peptide export ABC transporter [Stappia albiluteola]MBA5778728.1 cyclic peptide export ABC transporter [Stappia albiluteola]
MSQLPKRSSPTKSILILCSFLLKEGGLARSPVLAFAILASMTRAGMVFAINNLAASGVISTSYVVLLGICIVSTLYFSHLARIRSFRLVEAMKNRMRASFSRQLLNANASFLARHDQGKVYSIVTQEVNKVSRASVNMIQSIEAALLLVVCAPYLFYLSWPSGIAVLIAVMVGGSGYILAQRPAQATAERASRAEWLYFDRVNDVLRGYKELRLRGARKQALQADIENITRENRALTISAERFYSLGQVLAQGAMMGLLTAVVVGLPIVAGADTATVLQILTVVLMTYGPIETVLGNLSAFSRAAVSKHLIDQLERDLAADAEAGADRLLPDRPTFGRIELKGVTTRLSSHVPGGDAAGDTFVAGPIDLTLTPGEVVFITGGNGAGKSTFLSVLTGLRRPDSGEILVDGEPVNEASLGHYRSLFSAVFSEFHLFSKLYGMSEEECAALDLHIDELDLAHRVSIAGDRFSTLSLSTGQKRRLALAIALAEKRPIVVLDEFAADQDPARRAFFYDILVPQMARAGHLVIAVTHDEHCFDKCDRLIKMDAGRIVADTRPARGAMRLAQPAGAMVGGS